MYESLISGLAHDSFGILLQVYECALKSGFDFCNFLDCLRRLSNNLGLFSLT